MRAFICMLFFLMGAYGFSQQLIYKPKNPAFGGDTFNYQWLLSSADSQNSFTDPNLDIEELSDIDLFNESMNRKLLDQITSKLFEEQFGDDLLDPGTSTFGNLEIEVYESSEGLVINILDITTGEQSQIIIPNN
jgi:curli production assembly/transport component CsgF